MYLLLSLSSFYASVSFLGEKGAFDLRGVRNGSPLLFFKPYANAAPGRCSTSSKVVIVSQGNEDERLVGDLALLSIVVGTCSCFMKCLSNDPRPIMRSETAATYYLRIIIVEQAYDRTI